MQLEFTYADGMVRIKDVEIPRNAQQLDFSAPPGAFYTVLSSSVPPSPSDDTMTIWHEHGSLPIVSFKASECFLPVAGNIALLKPLIDAILTQSTPTPPSGTMTPVGTIYVSALLGSPTGNGSLADPIDTITAGIALADTNAQSDGLAWGVHVLTGSYDEQIVVPVSPVATWITLGSGAEVVYSQSPAPLVDATNGDTYITMEQGSVLANSGIGAVLYPENRSIVIMGQGMIRQDSPYPIIDMAAAGNVTIQGCTLYNADVANNTSMILQVDGTLRLIDVSLVSMSANAPITKSGGTTILMDYRNYSPIATNYAESPTPQDIQITSCFSNVNKGPQITETVEPMKHDAGFVI